MIKKRTVDQFYIWQTSTYGKPELQADESAELWLYRPMPCTPAGHFIADVITARMADSVLDELAGMSADEARAYVSGRTGFTVK